MKAQDGEGWIEWNGGECPVSGDTIVEYRMSFTTDSSGVAEAGQLFWECKHRPFNIVAYRVLDAWPTEDLAENIRYSGLEMAAQAEHNTQAISGGKLSGDHYYRVQVDVPISSEVKPYVAECADIIEALGMTFNEGEVFKALWRLAAARQGRGKPGNKAQYDADKAAHYGARVAAQTRRNESGSKSESDARAREIG